MGHGAGDRLAPEQGEDSQKKRCAQSAPAIAGHGAKRLAHQRGVAGEGIDSDAPDTDVTVKLLDVFPDGRVMNFQEGITRVRSRDGFNKVRLMEKGKVSNVPVDLHGTSWFLGAGHKRRVEISGSNFPRYDRHLNTGGRNYDESTRRTAHNSVHHRVGAASRLILPVVK